MSSNWLPDLTVHPAGEGRYEASWAVAADSPWFSGHFPNKPILPGLGLLALVVHVARLALDREDLRLIRVPKLRFKGVVLPGDGLDVALNLPDVEGGGAEVDFRFQVQRNGEEISAGRLVMAGG